MTEDERIFQSALILVLVAVIFTAFGFAVKHGTLTRCEYECEDLGEDTGYRTVYRNNDCLIEIAPGMLVEDEQVEYYLHHVERVESTGSKGGRYD